MTQAKSKRAKNPDTPEFTSKYYLTNASLLPAVLAAKEQNKLSNELATMLMMLTRRYAQRPCFANYSYKDDMISDALTNLCQNALKFNPEKSKNPFAFYTSCINNSFLQFLAVEKKHRRIRDQLLIDMGENPSFNFSEEHRSQQSGGEFSGELNELKNQIEEAKIRVKQEEAYHAAKLIEDARLVAESIAAITAEPIDVIADETVMKSSLLSFDEDESIPEEVR